MDLEARPFKYFITVAEEKSFSRAALRLNISQPALSAQIKALERRLGFDLFARTSRRVELTKEARLFLGHAQRFVGEGVLINRAAREIRTNELRISAPIETTLIPERVRLMVSFLNRYPNLQTRILNESQSKLLLSLTRREIDAAIVVEPSTSATEVILDEHISGTISGEAVERIQLGVREVELIVPANSPLAAHDIIPGDALKGVSVATVDRFHGISLSEALLLRLSALRADIVRCPEGNVLAVEQFGQAKAIAAVSLGWFQYYRGTQPGYVRRRVAQLSLYTHLNLIRLKGEHRPASDLLWPHATQFVEATNAPQS
jgi:DNA-binding transcriptional LysR family regulator